MVNIPPQIMTQRAVLTSFLQNKQRHEHKYEFSSFFQRSDPSVSD